MGLDRTLRQPQFAADDLDRRAAGQQLQHLLLPLGEFDATRAGFARPIRRRHHVGAVHFVEQVRRDVDTARQHELDRRKQCLRRHRLRHEAGGPELQHPHHVALVLLARQHEDLHFRRLRHHRFEQRRARHAGQAEIEHHEIEVRVLLLQLQGRLRGASRDDLGLGIEVQEQHRQGVRDQGVVVDDEDLHQVLLFRRSARLHNVRL